MDHVHSRRCPLYETTDIHRVMRRWEDCITNNENMIFSIIGRMHSWEETRNNEYSFILETLHNQKTKIQALQAKCATRQRIVANLVKSPTSGTSNTSLSIGYVVEEVKEYEIV